LKVLLSFKGGLKIKAHNGQLVFIANLTVSGTEINQAIGNRACMHVCSIPDSSLGDVAAKFATQRLTLNVQQQSDKDTKLHLLQIIYVRERF
jgi:hypothetical protein